MWKHIRSKFSPIRTRMNPTTLRLQGSDTEYEYEPTPIGYGSFSVLYRGWSLPHRFPVAIKKIIKIIHSEYFKNEIDLMQQLNHPNILKLFDVIQKNKNEQYLILEYCNGGELKEVLMSDDHTMDMDFFNQFMNGLEYLHLHRIVHRDIKPQNILIHNNTLKISDFGFAKLYEQDELIQTHCGTPLYMAPEIIHHHEYNTKSDIWSVGVILYELFSHTHPYRVSNKKELVKWMNQSSPTVDYSRLPADAPTDIIKACLQMDHTKRIGWNELFQQTRLFYRRYLVHSKESHPYNLPTREHKGDPVGKEYSLRTQPITQSPITALSLLKQPTPPSAPIPIQKSTIPRVDSFECLSPPSTSSSFSGGGGPPSLSESIVNNYIRTREASLEHEKPQIMLIGQSPTLKPTGFSTSLERSYKTFKNILKFNL